MPPQLKVYLVVDHDAVASEELTRLLQLAPDEHWDKGAPFLMAGKERRHRFNRWSIAESVGQLADMDDAVDRLIHRLTPIKENFCSLPKGTRVGFTVALTTPDAILGIGLSVQHVGFLASIGADIDLSIVVLAQPPPAVSA